MPRGCLLHMEKPQPFSCPAYPSLALLWLSGETPKIEVMQGHNSPVCPHHPTLPGHSVGSWQDLTPLGPLHCTPGAMGRPQVACASCSHQMQSPPLRDPMFH